MLSIVAVGNVVPPVVTAPPAIEPTLSPDESLIVPLFRAIVPEPPTVNTSPVDTVCDALVNLITFGVEPVDV